MKNTREKIILAALGLFNEQGLAKITLRRIALELNISQGNLNYHFKKREEIIEALYFELVAGIDEQMKTFPKDGPVLKMIMSISGATMELLYTYRFFLLDFTQILRDHPTIRTHYRGLLKQREQQITGMMQVLIKEGIMRKEELPNEYLNLYKRIQLTGDFWLASLELEKPGNEIIKSDLTEYSTMLNQMIYPYLTEKGKHAYHEYV